MKIRPSTLGINRGTEGDGRVIAPDHPGWWSEIQAFVLVYSERTIQVGQNVVLYTVATEPRCPLHWTRIRWRYSLVLQREDCCSETSAVALKHYISRGRTGELWWWLKTAPCDPRLFDKWRLLEAIVWIVYKMQPSQKYQRNFDYAKSISSEEATVEIFRWMLIILSRWKTAKMRSSSCIWPINCIPKIVLGCITPTWMWHDTMATSSWIWHKIRMMVCGFEPTYYRQNIHRSSTPI